MTRQHIHWKYTSEFPYIINLDSDFTPFLNGIEINYNRFNFKGGEPHLQLAEVDFANMSELVITQRFNKINDLFDIILANDAARRLGFRDIKLILPYFPAARQDRVCNEGEPLTIKVFTDMINNCGFNEVIILCPHSEVTTALLNNVTILDEFKYVDMIINSLDKSSKSINIVCPDAGAGKRVNKIVQHLTNQNKHIQFNLVRCEKIRNVKDGSIKEFFVDAEDLGGHKVIILDDICSMGGTFIGLGNKLKEKNCGELMLFTVHNDCIEGLDKMTNYFDHFFTTNSKRNWGELSFQASKLTCFNITL